MNAQTDHVTIVDHPLVQHKLTLMRKRETTVVQFRQLAREVALLLAYEVTRDLSVTTTPITTPLAEMTAPTLAGKKLCFVSILRAGDGLLQGSIRSELGNYVDPSGQLTLLLYSERQRDETFHDYVRVEVLQKEQLLKEKKEQLPSKAAPSP